LKAKIRGLSRENALLRERVTLDADLRAAQRHHIELLLELRAMELREDEFDEDDPFNIVNDF